MEDKEKQNEDISASFMWIPNKDTLSPIETPANTPEIKPSENSFKIRY